MDNLQGKRKISATDLQVQAQLKFGSKRKQQRFCPASEEGSSHREDRSNVTEVIESKT